MASNVYLAMTAPEFSGLCPASEPICWMACHFSPGDPGLSDLPPGLPEGSLVMLNDRLPWDNHDPGRILRQLEAACRPWSGLILDFQREETQPLRALAERLAGALPCPVAVSDRYGAGLDCPVFLSPCPHHVHLREHLAPWIHREIWLDLAADGETITLTKEGAEILPLPAGTLPLGGHCDEGLHCHYSMETGVDSARFTLWRSREDLDAMAQEARALGVERLVGLWQEYERYKI